MAQQFVPDALVFYATSRTSRSPCIWHVGSGEKRRKREKKAADDDASAQSHEFPWPDRRYLALGPRRPTFAFPALAADPAAEKRFRVNLANKLSPVEPPEVLIGMHLVAMETRNN
ncbi:hypothetical protein KM043_007852 [Ampulex compressa]|nr:hypothetical protein KM043_007852 [Ampulex compressa]